MRTPRKFPKTRARPSRIRTRCPSRVIRWGHRQPRGVIRPCTPRTRSTPRARSRRTESPRTRYPGRWGHRQPRESRQMRTPRTRSTPRARSRRTEPPRTQYPSRWGHRQPRESRPMRTPRTRSTPRARSRRTEPPRTQYPSRWGHRQQQGVSPDAHATHPPRRTVRRASARGVIASGSLAMPRGVIHVAQPASGVRTRCSRRTESASSPAARSHVTPRARSSRIPRGIRRWGRHARRSRRHALVRGAQSRRAHAVSEPVGSSPAARVSPRCARHARVRRHALVRRASARGVRAGGVIASRVGDPPVHATHAFDATLVRGAQSRRARHRASP